MIRLIVLALILYCLAPAFAQTAKLEAQKHICVADFMRLCNGAPNIITTAPRYNLLECIKAHRAEISRQCQKVLAEYGL